MSYDHLHVIIIDDDAVDRQAIKRIFQKSRPHWQLTSCVDKASGLEAINAGPCDLVLLDYILPGSTGLDVLHSLAEMKKSLPVVALSGHADQSTAIDMLRIGAADYLIKEGLTAERLTTTIETVVAADRTAYAARQQAILLESLARSTGGVVGTEFMHQLTQQLAKALHIDHVMIVEIDEQHANGLAFWSENGFLYPRQFDRQHPLLLDLITSGKQLFSKNISITFLEGHGSITGSCYAVPVQDKYGQTMGALLLIDNKINLDKTQRDVIALCVDRIGAEIARTQAEQALAEQLRVEQSLSRCACTLLADIDPEKTLDSALQHLLDTTKGDVLSVSISQVMSRGTFQGTCINRVQRPGSKKSQDDSQEYFQECFDRWWGELRNDRIIASPVSLLPGDEASILCTVGICSVLAVPIRLNKETKGYLRIDQYSDHRWLREEVAMLRSGAALLAAFLERRGAFQMQTAVA